MDDQSFAAPVLRDGDSAAKGAEKLDSINQQFKERDVRKTARSKGERYIDLKSAPLNQDAVRVTTWEDVVRTQAIPFDINGKILHVACVDPQNPETQGLMMALQEQGYQVEVYLCSAEGLQSTERFFKNYLSQEEVEVKTEVVEEDQKDWKQFFSQHQQTFETGTGPEMANVMNLEAVSFRASDVHFQPSEEKVVIRMRRDGQLYEVVVLTHKQFLLLSNEIKRAAGLKMNVRNIPQDGDYQFTVNERKMSVRVSTLPSKYGESIVLRMLDAEKAKVELDKLGYREPVKEIILEKSQRDRGLILVTGPTGSGKTSTLYSVLNKINSPEKKIITLEDPVEYELENIIQSQINEKEEFTFAKGLRAILRQDPDVIMVGEIRDREPAEIALQASLTGHLVLSTLHANDAIATIPRLLNMGIKEYILVAGLELVIAQRLVRRMCEKCRTEADLNETMKKEIDEAIASLSKKGITMEGQTVFTAKGCQECSETGYQGRVAISEVLPITDKLRQGILDKADVPALLEIAESEGFVRMREDGIMKALQGQTSLEEIWKVLI